MADSWHSNPAPMMLLTPTGVLPKKSGSHFRGRVQIKNFNDASTERTL